MGALAPAAHAAVLRFRPPIPSITHAAHAAEAASDPPPDCDLHAPFTYSATTGLFIGPRWPDPDSRVCLEHDDTMGLIRASASGANLGDTVTFNYSGLPDCVPTDFTQVNCVDVVDWGASPSRWYDTVTQTMTPDDFNVRQASCPQAGETCTVALNPRAFVDTSHDTWLIARAEMSVRRPTPPELCTRVVTVGPDEGCWWDSPDGTQTRWVPFVDQGWVTDTPVFIGAPLVPPTASFTATPAAVGALQWSFDASASVAHNGATIVSDDWDFSDPPTAGGQQVDHTFSRPGTFHVVLTVADSKGQTATAARDITVAPGDVVNSTGDKPLKKGAKACDTGSSLPGGAPECTLRAAIQALNRGFSTDITFNIVNGVAGAATITPASDLPAITKADATIDATTQLAGQVVLSGRGLTVTNAAGVTIKGLAIVGGSGYAVTYVDSANGKIVGNSIGITADGTKSPPAGGIAVVGSAHATIGGAGAAANVVGATDAAILIAPSATNGSDGVAVTGNDVGVDASGAPLLSAPGALGVIAFADTGTSAKMLRITKNTVAGFKRNIVLAGVGAAGAKVTGNHVGTDPSGGHTIGAAIENIRVDAVPNLTVGSNVVAGATRDILVAGSIQLSTSTNPDGSLAFRFNSPSNADDTEPKVATNDTISGNTVGLIALAGGAHSVDGIQAWESADGVAITGNTIGGHSDTEISLGGGTGDSVGTNTVGVTGPTEAASNGVSVDQTDGATIDGNTIGRVVNAIRLKRSTGAIVTNNTTGLLADGASAAADTAGLQIPAGVTGTVVGPNNVFANAGGAGAIVAGNHTTVIGNTFGVPRFGAGKAPDGTGIVVAAATTAVVVGSSGHGNTIAGNKVGIDLQNTGSTVAFNTLGVITSGARGNDTGINAAHDASIHDNTIANSKSVGVAVAGGAIVTLRHNAIYATSSKTGIGGAPPAPTLAGAARVQHGTTVRTWLVVTGLPAHDAGTIEVFGNTKCTDPEGKVPLFTKAPTAGKTTRVISIAGRADLKGLTVTYTTHAGLTSVFSGCADAKAQPDSDGDGIPDLVEAQAPATTTTEHDGTNAAFVTDSDQWVDVQTTAGTLTGVSPIDDPNSSGHPSVSFPLGMFTFRVTGVPVGQVSNVQLVVPGGAPVTGWWKYGPTTPGGTAHFYAFGFNKTSHTGAKVSTENTAAFGLSTVVVLSIQDGGRGDSDTVADGSITDPGGPTAAASAGRSRTLARY